MSSSFNLVSPIIIELEFSLKSLSKKHFHKLGPFPYHVERLEEWNALKAVGNSFDFVRNMFIPTH